MVCGSQQLLCIDTLKNMRELPLYIVMLSELLLNRGESIRTHLGYWVVMLGIHKEDLLGLIPLSTFLRVTS